MIPWLVLIFADADFVRIQLFEDVDSPLFTVRLCRLLEIYLTCSIAVLVNFDRVIWILLKISTLLLVQFCFLAAFLFSFDFGSHLFGIELYSVDFENFYLCIRSILALTTLALN